MPTDKEHLSLEEVAGEMGVTYQLIYRLVRSGELPAARLGKLYRVSRTDLNAYLERSKREAAERQLRRVRTYYRCKGSLDQACDVCERRCLRLLDAQGRAAVPGACAET
jgi:excisionase family DNA binding protein